MSQSLKLWPLWSRIKYLTPSAAIFYKLEKKLPAVAAVRDMRGMAWEMVAICAWHVVPSLERPFQCHNWSFKPVLGPILASFSRLLSHLRCSDPDHPISPTYACSYSSAL